MSKKQVRETKAAQSLSAYVVINPKGDHVATVQAHFTDSGMCRVDVWGNHELIHQGAAGGYGYDKFSAALAGAKIEDIEIFDHAVRCEEGETLRERVKGMSYEQARDTVEPYGFRISNWGTNAKSVYPIQGLDRLSTFGYKVIQAI